MQRSTLLLLPFLAAPAAGQVATALLREADVLPSGNLVDALNNTAVNQSGGYAVTATTTDGTTDFSVIWGNLAGGAGSVLRSEATIGTLEQTSIESFFGISAAGIVYSPLSNDIASGTTSLDGVWLDDSIVAIEEQPSSVAGEFWSFGSRPGVTQGGAPYFVGGVTPTQGGSTTSRGLFFGAGSTPLLISGGAVPGLPFVLSGSPVDFDFRFSAMGTNFITPVDMVTSSTEDSAVVVSGAGLMIGGALVQEGVAVPAAAGGLPMENWDSFDFCGITESGSYFFTGDTDGDLATDEFLLKDGVILVREGDTIDGELIRGSIEGAYMNEAGLIAYVWDVDDNGAEIEALFLGDQLLLKQGDQVDWDGDGMIDANTVVTNFTGTSTVTLDASGVVYCTIDVAVAGILLEGYFAISSDAPVGMNYCMANANSTGFAANIGASGSDTSLLNDLTLLASSMPAGQFGFFVNSLTQGFVPNAGGSQGNLCVIGNVGRYNSSIFLTNPAGSTSLVLDLTMTPTPFGNVSILAGETWNFQAWFRDLNPGSTSNFTDGLSITFN